MLIRKAAIAALNSEAISVLQNFVAGLFRPSDAYQKGRYCRRELRGDFEATESQRAAQRRSTENPLSAQQKFRFLILEVCREAVRLVLFNFPIILFLNGDLLGLTLMRKKCVQLSSSPTACNSRVVVLADVLYIENNTTGTLSATLSKRSVLSLNVC